VLKGNFASSVFHSCNAKDANFYSNTVFILKKHTNESIKKPDSTIVKIYSKDNNFLSNNGNKSGTVKTSREKT
jgi:hypothetical protein